MHALLLLALLDLSLPCLAQLHSATPSTDPAPIFTPTAVAPAIPRFDLRYWTQPLPNRTEAGCDPMVLRPRTSESIDKGFILAPPTAPAPRTTGCATPSLQLLAGIARPSTPLQTIPPETPHPLPSVINLSANTSLRFSHGMQLRFQLK